MDKERRGKKKRDVVPALKFFFSQGGVASRGKTTCDWSSGSLG